MLINREVPMNAHLSSLTRSYLVALAVAFLVGEAAPTAQALLSSKVSVSAPDGTFEFTDLSAKDRNSLVGVARNATSHDWFTAVFEAVLIDKNGKPARASPWR
jgi:hypothetical protein